MTDVSIQFTTLSPLARVPQQMTAEAAGCDLCAALEAPVELKMGERRLVPTGLAMAIPKGFEGQVRPRSGLAFKHGVTVLNSPGTIDSDYRGEVQVLLINHGNQAYAIQPGERVAQLVIARVGAVAWRAVSELSSTERAAGGFGSTGHTTPSPSLEKNIL